MRHGRIFRRKWKACRIFYDDLSKHAVAYREPSLLIQRPPGREASPATFSISTPDSSSAPEIFERARRRKSYRSAGNRTQAGDVSAYIPTNVISITDGQIYLESDLFYAGIRPAINVGLSVSRVGGKAQTKMMKQVAGMLKIDLAQYRELASFAQFGSDLDKETIKRLTRGERMTEMLKQPQYVPMPIEEQVVVIHAAVNGDLDEIELSEVREFERQFIPWLKDKHAAILTKLKSTRELSDDVKKDLDNAIKEFKTGFVKSR